MPPFPQALPATTPMPATARARPCLALTGLLALLCAPSAFATPSAPPTPFLHGGEADLSAYFEGLDGSFVLLDAAGDRVLRHNPARAAQRFAPCSTFKIPHTAILLETGTARDADHALAYDPALAQPAHWARDFTLASAFQASALWYYQAMARTLGLAAEAELLRRFDYGNADTQGGLDAPFWVDGSLRISPDEQVAFLRALREGRLGLSERSTQLTQGIMQVESTPRWRLYAKTGACRPEGEQTANWYVGYVERDARVFYFALQLGADDYGRSYEARVPLTRRILADLGILD